LARQNYLSGQLLKRKRYDIMAKILITGAGSGFAKDAALALAKKGHQVIAAVEVPAQISALEQESNFQKLSNIQFEKLDITQIKDCERAWTWDIDILINNAGISEGGAVVDIPMEHIRRQFEVNVFGQIQLSQGFLRKWVKQKKKAKLFFVSSVAGLSTDPFTGAYSASKHALEAFAEATYKEMLPYAIRVATLNPGPYLTGFNDRMFETWRTWDTDPQERVFQYDQLSFPHEQYDPVEVVRKIVELVDEEVLTYRNVLPESAAADAKEEQLQKWSRLQTEGLGKKHQLVRAAEKLKPGTPVSKAAKAKK